MQPWEIGVFASIDAGLGVQLEVVRDLGVKTVQLHTPHKPSRTPEKARDFSAKLRDYGIAITTVVCGFDGESYESIEVTKQTVGLVPESFRAARIAETKEISDFAKLLGVREIGSHIGFVPHDRSSAAYKSIVEATREVVKYAKNNGQTYHLETGQEPADNLLAFIDDVAVDTLFINFDPANLILYGIGDPIGALKKVGHKVRGVHCKDAIASDNPGVTWGREVPFGRGEVNAKLFLETLKATGYRGALTIEREIPEDPQRQKAEVGEVVTLIKSLRNEVL
ncbi:MAG: sugar phosphate isomerase/epimerase family protein [Thermoguttaceae bacterium]